MPRNVTPDNIAETHAKPSPRCRACQLQLCKSRRESPHAALTEIFRDDAGRFVRYACQSCGATLVRSEDLNVPGWTAAR